MSIDNLDIVKRLIAEKECGRVEFKETTGQLERGMETLCAFLNGEGGTVLFGVTDKEKNHRTRRERQDQEGYSGRDQPVGACGNGTNILCTAAGQ